VLDNVHVVLQTTGLKWLELGASEEGALKKLQQRTIDKRT